MAILVIVLTFATGFLAVFSANLVLLDIARADQKRLKKRMGEELIRKQRERAQESQERFKNLGQLQAEAFQEVNDQAGGIKEWLQLVVDQSGLNVTRRKLLTMALGSALVLGLIAFVVFPHVIAAVVGAIVGASIPMLVVQLKRYQRIELLRSQLPDSFDLMARILRAGQSMPQAMQAVAQEFNAPVAVEFAYCYEQQNLGLPMEYALRDLAKRTGLLEVKIFVLALLVHQQTGGNLTTILENLAFIVRDRFRIRGMISSLTAEGRVQAAILLALPPIMAGILFIQNRTYAMKLFDHPYMLLTSVVFMGLGALWIHKIVNFDF